MKFLFTKFYKIFEKLHKDFIKKSVRTFFGTENSLNWINSTATKLKSLAITILDIFWFKMQTLRCKTIGQTAQIKKYLAEWSRNILFKNFSFHPQKIKVSMFHFKSILQIGFGAWWKKWSFIILSEHLLDNMPHQQPFGPLGKMCN